MIELGQKVKDVVTGYTGIAIQKVEYLNGCIQYAVKSKAKDGKNGHTSYIDYEQLIVVNKKSILVKKFTKKKKPTGGPDDVTIENDSIGQY